MNEGQKLALEGKILRFFQNKEIINERKEENNLLFEEIAAAVEADDAGEDIVLQLPNGEYAVMKSNSSKRRSLSTTSLSWTRTMRKPGRFA